MMHKAAWWIQAAMGLVLVMAAVLVPGTGVASEEDGVQEMKVLFDFSESESGWYSVDDSVMGGISASRIKVKDGEGIFAGILSLENNGGFASVRSATLEADLSGTHALRLRVKGDGQRYQMRIYAEGGRSGISYRASFDTRDGEWIEVMLPYKDFEAGWRGRSLPDHPPIDPAQIYSLGLLIADKQEGAFELHVDWIGTVRSQEPEDEP